VLGRQERCGASLTAFRRFLASALQPPPLFAVFFLVVRPKVRTRLVTKKHSVDISAKGPPHTSAWAFLKNFLEGADGGIEMEACEKDALAVPTLLFYLQRTSR
jgi:hypothetical protein